MTAYFECEECMDYFTREEMSGYLCYKCRDGINPHYKEPKLSRAELDELDREYRRLNSSGGA